MGGDHPWWCLPFDGGVPHQKAISKGAAYNTRGAQYGHTAACTPRRCARIVHPAYPEHLIGQNFVQLAIFWLISQNAENCACLNLDALSVPEALVHSIRILEVPAVYLKHRWLKS